MGCSPLAEALVFFFAGLALTGAVSGDADLPLEAGLSATAFDAGLSAFRAEAREEGFSVVLVMFEL